MVFSLLFPKSSRELVYETAFSSIYLLPQKNLIVKKVEGVKYFYREKRVFDLIEKKPCPFVLNMLQVDPIAREFTLPRASSDLFDWVWTQQSLIVPKNIPIFAKYLHDLTRGLKHLYDCHIEHYDIKPENLLLFSSHQQLKIADFGLAIIDAQQYNYLQGTFSYMSPEIASQEDASEDYIRSSMDVYSASMTILYCFFPHAVGKFQTEVPMSLSNYRCHLSFLTSECKNEHLFSCLFPTLLQGIEIQPHRRPNMNEWSQQMSETLESFIV